MKKILRKFDKNKPVWVYRNVTANCYSVQQDGLVVMHVSSINLQDCSFIVREGGRQRVLKRKKKNVHAFVKGRMNGWNRYTDDRQRVSYNPFKNDSFVCGDKAISKASDVVLTASGVFVAGDLEFKEEGL